MQLRDLLVVGDARFDVGLLLGLLLEEHDHVVPTLGALEEPPQLAPRAFVRGIEGEDRLPGPDRAVEVAQLALAEARELSQPTLAHVLVDGVVLRRALEDVPELREFPRLPEVALEVTDRLHVGRLEGQHLVVLLGRVALLAAAGQAFRLLQQRRDRVHVDGRGLLAAGRPGGRGCRASPGGRRCGLRSRSARRCSPEPRCGTGIPRHLARLAREGSVRVHLEVRRRPRGHLGGAPELLSVEDGKLDGPVVPRLELERADRIGE
ncbi:MAG TPA: hypothetical protein PLU22_25955, partial [Polyangiaceae bacterium]|nr:hypothetical protein [Polyangiaceae bacterium]